MTTSTSPFPAMSVSGKDAQPRIARAGTTPEAQREKRDRERLKVAHAGDRAERGDGDAGCGHDGGDARAGAAASQRTAHDRSGTGGPGNPADGPADRLVPIVDQESGEDAEACADEDGGGEACAEPTSEAAREHAGSRSDADREADPVPVAHASTSLVRVNRYPGRPPASRVTAQVSGHYGI